VKDNYSTLLLNLQANSNNLQTLGRASRCDY